MRHHTSSDLVRWKMYRRKMRDEASRTDWQLAQIARLIFLANFKHEGETTDEDFVLKFKWVVKEAQKQLELTPAQIAARSESAWLASMGIVRPPPQEE